MITQNTKLQDLTSDEQLDLDGGDGEVGQCTRVEAYFQGIGENIRAIVLEALSVFD